MYGFSQILKLRLEAKVEEGELLCQATAVFWYKDTLKRQGLVLQGRLIDHVRNTQSIGLEDLQVLVLDEADRLLEMGFSEEVS